MKKLICGIGMIIVLCMAACTSSDDNEKEIIVDAPLMLFGEWFNYQTCYKEGVNTECRDWNKGDKGKTLIFHKNGTLSFSGSDEIKRYVWRGDHLTIDSDIYKIQYWGDGEGVLILTQSAEGGETNITTYYLRKVW